MKKKPGRAAEGGVYACAWRVLLGQFRLECAIPKLKVDTGSLAEGKDSLRSAIMAATGDGEPFLEFDRPLPTDTAARQTRPEYFDLGWNDSVQCRIPAGGTGLLHEEGACPRCGIGFGQRTTIRREVTSVPRYDFAGFYKDRSRGIMLSAHVCDLLLERAPISVQRVDVIWDSGLKAKTKQKFYELSASPQVASVYPRDLTVSSGWRCPRCKRSNMFITSQLAGNARYCLRRSEAIGAVLFVRYGPWTAISVSKEFRRQLVQDRRISGLVTERVAVLDDDEVMAEANLPLRKLKPIQL